MAQLMLVLLSLTGIFCNVWTSTLVPSSSKESHHEMIHHNLFLPSMDISKLINTQIIKSYPIKENNTDDSPICREKIMKLLNSVRKTGDEPLAQKFFDALGKPPSGIFEGNNVFMGSYDTCIAPDMVLGDYKPCKVKANALLNNKTIVPLVWTVCFPAECRGGNYTELAEFFLEDVNYHPNQFFVYEESINTTCTVQYDFSIGSYVAVVLVALIVFMVLVGTSWEPISVVVSSLQFSDDHKRGLVNANDTEAVAILPDNSPIDIQANFITTKSSKTSTVESIFKCFSLNRTFSALLDTQTKDGQILCLNGIRVLSINWVVLGHIYYIGSNATGDMAYAIELLQRTEFAFVFNGLTSVDSFFLLSGLLVSLLLLKDLARTRGRFRAAGYYIHRYIRLTAPFLVVTLVQGFFAHIYIKGPFDEIITHGYESCKKYWWTNILYINNLVPWNSTEMCVSQSWYLSNDFQFYLVAPLFIWLLYKNYKIGIPVTVLTLCASCICAGVITYMEGFGPTTVFESKEGDFHDFRLLYDKPWIRCPPYLIGILGGWFCYKHMDSLKLYISTLAFMPKLLVGSFLWAITGLIEYWVVFGLHNDMIKYTRGEELNLIESVMYETFARSAWALALVTQVILCQCDLGGVINTVLSWKGWIVLSRLTFSVYLLHYIIIHSYVAQLRHPFFYSPDLEVAVVYGGILMLSYAAATLLFTFVEQPVTFLERVIYRKQ